MDHVTVQRTCQACGDWPNPFVVYYASYYSATVIDCAHTSDLLLTQESWTNKVSQDLSRWVSGEWLSIPILQPPLGNLVIYHLGRLVPINQTSISWLIILFVQKFHHALDNLDAWGWSVPIVAISSIYSRLNKIICSKTIKFERGLWLGSHQFNQFPSKFSGWGCGSIS